MELLKKIFKTKLRKNDIILGIGIYTTVLGFIGIFLFNTYYIELFNYIKNIEQDNFYKYGQATWKIYTLWGLVLILFGTAVATINGFKKKKGNS